MAKRFFHTLSTTLQQHSSRHIRRHHPLKNKTHFHHKYSHPSFSPTPNLLSSFKKSEFVAWYLNKLETNPIITKAVTSSLICAAADLSSQMIRKPPVYGLLILGPSQHLWFNFLSNILPTRGLVSTLMKTYLNYVFFSYDDNRFQGEKYGPMQGCQNRYPTKDHWGIERA
ncbi:hypothetical protein MTR_6g038550 [Medicago truncatula]|uniref:Uncharacterized protein n=1 Tax=Medicago truncatula TaxID=3880 RepID=A0A072UA63_MEDTR|nr:hypothetical protein MTR_6g038550 [Medicago truncatula]